MLHPEFKALALGAILVALAGAPAQAQSDEDSREGIDLVTLLKADRRIRTLPILVEDRSPDDRYRLLAEIDRDIERRPSDPGAFERRAWIWLELGWPRRARLDFSRARQLRRMAEAAGPGLD